MQIFFSIYLLLFIFALLYLKATLFWIYLWQVKEYRLDRFLSEYRFLGKLLRFWFFSGGRKFHRPVFTVKVLMIYVISLFAIFGSVYLVLQGFFYGAISSILVLISGLFALYFLIPFIVVVVIYLLQIPVILAKSFIYEKAARKIANMPDLTVIGITGSYGKTSTKEFLAQILEKKFKVIKTPKNINTEIGVAKFVLSNVSPLTRFAGATARRASSGSKGVVQSIFIAEMGAYKRGEIKRICDIVKPKIGIVTGINEQHLDLFGSFENIIDTKYELIESLPKDGLAIFNGENKYCLEMAKRWGGKKITYNANDANKYANYANMPNHYLQNLAGSMEVAKYLGMADKEIREAVKDIRLTDRMIKTFAERSGAVVIDDTYSANPSGVLAGLDYLAEQKQKTKIIVMPCLIELGEAGERIHREIAQKIVRVCDLAIITTHDFFHEMKQEASNKVVLAVQPEKVIELLKDKLGPDVAILLEGRLQDEIVEFLKIHPNPPL